MHDHGMGAGHGQVHQQGQAQPQQQQQWVVVQGHPGALNPQHQPVSVAVVCDAMAELHAMAGNGTTMLPLTAVYAQPQYVQFQPAVGNMASRPGMQPAAPGMQYAAPPAAYMQAPHMQQHMQPSAQRYGQGLWSDVPGMQQRGRAPMGQHPMMMQAAGPPAVTKGSTVEEILQVVRHMPRGASVIAAVRDSLQYLDSRALAALLKELSKTGLRDMAFHIFNWLREPMQSMDPAYGGLLDVFTYTTMIVSSSLVHPQDRSRSCQYAASALLQLFASGCMCSRSSKKYVGLPLGGHSACLLQVLCSCWSVVPALHRPHLPAVCAHCLLPHRPSAPARCTLTLRWR